MPSSSNKPGMIDLLLVNVRTGSSVVARRMGKPRDGRPWAFPGWCSRPAQLDDDAAQLEDALRDVERGDERAGVGPAQDVLAVPAVAAARVEDALAAAQVEAVRLEHPARQNVVAGDEAGDGGQLAGEAVVVPLDEAPVL